MIKLYAVHSSGFECLGSVLGMGDRNRIMRKLTSYGYEMIDTPELETNSRGDITGILVPSRKS